MTFVLAFEPRIGCRLCANLRQYRCRRPVLRSFHLKMLCINGDKDKTYTYEQLQTKTSLENHVKTGLARYAELKASTAQVDNTDMANVLKDRSRGFEHVVEDRNDRKKEFKIKFDKVGVIPRFFALMTMGTIHT